jgi:hypothetical protein
MQPERQMSDATPKLEWHKPEVIALNAKRAEIGGTNANDSSAVPGS